MEKVGKTPPLDPDSEGAFIIRFLLYTKIPTYRPNDQAQSRVT